MVIYNLGQCIASFIDGRNLFGFMGSTRGIIGFVTAPSWTIGLIECTTFCKLYRHQDFGIYRIVDNLALWHGTTSRERPKSAPYLRLKNSKRTSKCQSILFYGTGKIQKLNRIGAPEGRLWNFSPILSQIIKKNWRGTFGEKNFLKKVSQCRKNKRGTIWDFSTSVLSENSKKNWRGDPLGNFFSKKSLTEPKIL